MCKIEDKSEEQARAWLSAFSPCVRAFCTSKVFHGSFSRDARVFTGDSGEPLEGFHVSTFGALSKYSHVFGFFVRGHVDEVGLIRFPLFLRFRCGFGVDCVPTSGARVAFFSSCHAGTALITEFHIQSRGSSYRSLLIWLYCSFNNRVSALYNPFASFQSLLPMADRRDFEWCQVLSFFTTHASLRAKFLIVRIPSSSLRTSPFERPKAMFQYVDPGTIMPLIKKKNVS